MDTAPKNQKKNHWLKDLLLNKCPICREAHVFTGLYKMNAVCPVCSTKYAREEGYFLGSMIVAYVLSAFSAAPTIIFLIMIKQVEALPALVIASIQVALLNPILFMYSRLAWIYIDRLINPKSWS